VAIVAFAGPAVALVGLCLLAAMGFLWLSTVPLTNATIAQIFGVQHLSMLGGFVFFSHQIGSFLGVWLGGYLYDINGNYDMVWYLSIALGILPPSSTCPCASSHGAHGAPEPLSTAH
jgi:predicted MFS family arabinose efflux permease